MPKVMEIIAKETNGKSYNTEKYSFDSIGVPSFDYDDSPDRVIKWKDVAETELHKRYINLMDLAHNISGEEPLLRTMIEEKKEALYDHCRLPGGWKNILC